MFGFRWHILCFANSIAQRCSIAFWALICWQKWPLYWWAFPNTNIPLAPCVIVCHWQNSLPRLFFRFGHPSRWVAKWHVYRLVMDEHSILSAFGNSFSFRLFFRFIIMCFFGLVRCSFLSTNEYKWIYLVFADAAEVWPLFESTFDGLDAVAGAISDSAHSICVRLLLPLLFHF